MQFSAILFDLDGTLVDSITIYNRAVVESFGKMGATITIEQMDAWYKIPYHLRDMMRVCGIDPSRENELRDLRDRLYMERLAKEVTWLTGAEDLLASLLGKVPLGMITGSWRRYLDAMQLRIDVFSPFQSIITADDIHTFMKPHPHGLLLAADQLGVDPKDCIYIGDQRFDIEAANAAGMTSCLVKGMYTPEGAEKDADVVVERLEDLRVHF